MTSPALVRNAEWITGEIDLVFQVQVYSKKSYLMLWLPDRRRMTGGLCDCIIATIMLPCLGI